MIVENKKIVISNYVKNDIELALSFDLGSFDLGGKHSRRTGHFINGKGKYEEDSEWRNLQRSSITSFTIKKYIEVWQ